MPPVIMWKGQAACNRSGIGELEQPWRLFASHMIRVAEVWGCPPLYDPNQQWLIWTRCCSLPVHKVLTVYAWDRTINFHIDHIRVPTRSLAIHFGDGVLTVHEDCWIISARLLNCVCSIIRKGRGAAEMKSSIAFTRRSWEKDGLCGRVVFRIVHKD